MSTSSRYHHGDLRNAILAAAEELVDAETGRALSLREIARSVGVSHAAPYKHFGSVGQLRDALAARWLGQLVDVQASAATGTPREALLAAGRAYVEWATTHPARYAAVYDPSVERGADADPALAAEAERHTELLMRLVGDARTAGVLTGNADAEAAHLWASVHGIASLVTLGLLAPGAVPAALGATVGG